MFTTDLLRNPIEGNFTVAADRGVIRPVLIASAERFAEYAASGADSWDCTIDVHNRPLWLKKLAGVTEEFECPAVDPSLTNFADLKRPFRPRVVFNPVSGSADDDPTSEPTTITAKVSPVDIEEVAAPHQRTNPYKM